MEVDKTLPLIVLDGPNVAYQGGNDKTPNYDAVFQALQYWEELGYPVLAIFPSFWIDADTRFRKENPMTEAQQQVLNRYVERKFIAKTPGRVSSALHGPCSSPLLSLSFSCFPPGL